MIKYLTFYLHLHFSHEIPVQMDVAPERNDEAKKLCFHILKAQESICTIDEQHPRTCDFANESSSLIKSFSVKLVRDTSVNLYAMDV